MAGLSSDQIRETFLTFFEKHNHLRIKGASLLPKQDPTLLFINAGMAAIKPYFTGKAVPPCPRLCNVQPCIRTKDIDDVGDRHHLTLFEMLGSWSIGDYFKEQAIALAYDLLVNGFGFPREKLYATVYGGSEEIGLPCDDESIEAWVAAGMPRNHVIVLGQDNFWGPAGEMGPCGPCTEVFYDCGESYGPAYDGVDPETFDTKRRYIEIWNAGVFMQYDKQADGSFVKLPFKSVDTGSGLERMAMVLSGVDSVYDTDLLKPLVDFAVAQFGDYQERLVPVYRRIADHMRATTFIFAEGVRPSNEGQGYIPRRLVRKCMALTAREGCPNFDYEGIINLCIDRFAAAYPRLSENREQILEIFRAEQKDFSKVIERGLAKLDALAEAAKTAGVPWKVSGADAFYLFATFGMPFELSRDFVLERGGEIDEAGFRAEFANHKKISRAKAKDGEVSEISLADQNKTVFLGYDQDSSTAKVTALLVNAERVNEASGTFDAVFDQTPFYAEMGGQTSDTGTGKIGGIPIEITAVRKVAGIFIHRCTAQGTVHVGESAELQIDVPRRKKIAANHSATHLMHAALRELLGTHVHQAGSKVDENELRFDFHHPAKVTDDELWAIEQRVNGWICDNIKQTTDELPYDQAIARGALAFFGDTYGAIVRTVQFPGASVELCGGTHVKSSGDIGLFRFVSESSVAAGIRRVVAYTGLKALEYAHERELTLRGISQKLGVAIDKIPERLDRMIEQQKAQKAAGKAASAASGEAEIRTVAGIPCICQRTLLDQKDLRQAALDLADKHNVFACLLNESDGKAAVMAVAAESLVKQVSAGKFVSAALPLVDGRGGGKPRMAQGGGARIEGLAQIEAQFEALLTAAKL